jgi:hypothetical protein
MIRLEGEGTISVGLATKMILVLSKSSSTPYGVGELVWLSQVGVVR